MSLIGIVNTGVAVAHKITKNGGLQAAITFERCNASTGSGKRTYDAAVELTAIIEGKQKMIERDGVLTALTGTSVLILDKPGLLAATLGNGIRLVDRITLPDGRSMPIMATDGFIGSDTGIPVATEAFLA